MIAICEVLVRSKLLPKCRRNWAGFLEPLTWKPSAFFPGSPALTPTGGPLATNGSGLFLIPLYSIGLCVICDGSHRESRLPLYESKAPSEIFSPRHREVLAFRHVKCRRLGFLESWSCSINFTSLLPLLFRAWSPSMYFSMAQT